MGAGRRNSRVQGGHLQKGRGQGGACGRPRWPSWSPILPQGQDTRRRSAEDGPGASVSALRLCSWHLHMGWDLSPSVPVSEPGYHLQWFCIIPSPSLSPFRLFTMSPEAGSAARSLPSVPRLPEPFRQLNPSCWSVGIRPLGERILGEARVARELLAAETGSSAFGSRTITVIHGERMQFWILGPPHRQEMVCASF